LNLSAVQLQLANLTRTWAYAALDGHTVVIDRKVLTDEAPFQLLTLAHEFTHLVQMHRAPFRFLWRQMRDRRLPVRQLRDTDKLAGESLDSLDPLDSRFNTEAIGLYVGEEIARKLFGYVPSH
jgi:hypothetical protein